jgi:hypothetical protein
MLGKNLLSRNSLAVANKLRFGNNKNEKKDKSEEKSEETYTLGTDLNSPPMESNVKRYAANPNYSQKKNSSIALHLAESQIEARSKRLSLFKSFLGTDEHYGNSRKYSH